MNEAIKLARNNGWYGIIEVGEIEDGDGHGYEVEELAILDPLFWQALGKALGWAEGQKNSFGTLIGVEWLVKAHQYFDLVLTGGDTEKFWKELLK